MVLNERSGLNSQLARHMSVRTRPGNRNVELEDEANSSYSSLILLSPAHAAPRLSSTRTLHIRQTHPAALLTRHQDGPKNQAPTLYDPRFLLSFNLLSHSTYQLSDHAFSRESPRRSTSSRMSRFQRPQALNIDIHDLNVHRRLSDVDTETRRGRWTGKEIRMVSSFLDDGAPVLMVRVVQYFDDRVPLLADTLGEDKEKVVHWHSVKLHTVVAALWEGMAAAFGQLFLQSPPTNSTHFVCLAQRSGAKPWTSPFDVSPSSPEASLTVTCRQKNEP
ncbi:uncharacterized protein MYCFIDRAFT_170131 [Pseudocercospora fijiensis CIRAD86]|uniref:Uncharacterized protein n=1 Tax=Pseudocercospora fijiensis (strain CIRAD86) TaxID=383855 RepID=N1Q7B2_PSEFD|nr:uncharacterized protein MYCFIDRAFT_170131 [Pseudocercospora fijiensis CIRAD86]EME88524.1 hypothetical protein MYCFIDRAFT_170131 [Pseudocercospora fijiensis CIRAD86]